MRRNRAPFIDTGRTWLLAILGWLLAAHALGSGGMLWLLCPVWALVAVHSLLLPHLAALTCALLHQPQSLMMPADLCWVHYWMLRSTRRWVLLAHASCQPALTLHPYWRSR